MYLYMFIFIYAHINMKSSDEIHFKIQKEVDGCFLAHAFQEEMGSDS